MAGIVVGAFGVNVDVVFVIINLAPIIENACDVPFVDLAVGFQIVRPIVLAIRGVVTRLRILRGFERAWWAYAWGPH